MKTYIIHVKGESKREAHILEQISGRGLDHEFVLDGDIPDLTKKVLNDHFEGDLATAAPATSCAFKHFLVYRRMANEGVSLALVLEDDIVLYSKWDKLIPLILKEIEYDKLSGFIISLEDSSLKYPKGSKRRKGKYIYPAIAGRTTGAYLIDIAAAKAILKHLETHKCNLPIGIFQNGISQAGKFEFYWAHPPVAVQGTATGAFSTSIAGHQKSLFRRFSFQLERIYKKLTYKMK